MKKTITTIVIVILVGLVIYLIAKSGSQPPASTENQATTTETTNTGGAASSTPNDILTNGAVSVIGTSVQNRPINAYHYGTGTSTELLFVGGIHGGYEWNTVLVAFELMDYLQANPDVIPANVRVTVIPVLNPDGLNKVVGTTTGNFTAADVSTDQSIGVSGRFNGNNVDLNRNFDCDWQATGKWQSKTVSGGTAAFSEPESQAVKNFVATDDPTAVVVWYSAAGGVYASNCHNGVLPVTTALVNAYAAASGYSANQSFDYYATTGDMTNWLAKSSIPTISVLLSNHTDTEWSRNLLGVKAVLKYYAK
jgi:murein tripeptide amidase MpaA